MESPFCPGYYVSQELRDMGFARVGEGVRIARNCTIIGLEHIVIGDRVRIDGYTTIVGVHGGELRIGSNVHICSGCVLGARGGIELGDYSSLSHGVKLLSAVDDFGGDWMTNSTLPEWALHVQAAAIRIGRHVPIGSGSLILPGVMIGEGAAIAAMSVVSYSLPEWMICGGNPATPLKRRSSNLLSKEAALRARTE